MRESPVTLMTCLSRRNFIGATSRFMTFIAPFGKPPVRGVLMAMIARHPGHVSW